MAIWEAALLRIFFV